MSIIRLSLHGLEVLQEDQLAQAFQAFVEEARVGIVQNWDRAHRDCKDHQRPASATVAVSPAEMRQILHAIQLIRQGKKLFSLEEEGKGMIPGLIHYVHV